MSKKSVTITIDRTSILKGKKRAVQEYRSFSNYIEWLIINDSKHSNS